MYQIVDFSTFARGFEDMGRNDQFSYHGLRALFDYLEELEGHPDDLAGQIRFDVVGLCCDYTEYETIADYNQAYGTEHESIDDLANEGYLAAVFDGGLIVHCH